MVSEVFNVKKRAGCLKYFSVTVLVLYLLLYLSSDVLSGPRQTERFKVVDESREILQKMPTCPSRIAIAWDEGRLGNKFFEYLVARLIANRMGSRVYITEAFGKVYDNYFTGRRAEIVNWTNLHKCGFRRWNCLTLSVSLFPELESIPNVTHRCIAFEGYPVNMTAKHWEAIYSQRDELIKEFQWKSDVRDWIKEKLQKVRTSHKTWTVVAVHARRTDYKRYLIPYYGSFHPADASYYTRAMDYFRNKYRNPAFLVFSDDMEWSRQNLNASDVDFAGNGNQVDPGFDLALISSCDHIVLSYGTFGMMAAWFNNHGEIISADNFTGRPETMVQELKKVANLNWIWMPVQETT